MAWTTPRTFITGEVETAAIFNAHLRDNLNALVDRIQVVRKPTDQSLISNTVLTADTSLLFTAVAGQDYEFECGLIFNNGSSAMDAKIGFSFPAGTLSFGRIAMDPAVASGTIGSGIWDAVSVATSGTSALTVGVVANDTSAKAYGSFHCTTGGVVTLMWAQNTSTASNLTLKAGSTLRAIRVAV